MSIIQKIIDIHAEEAAFLWLLRRGAVHAPHYDLEDLAKLDARVEAHIHGLRTAGEIGWQTSAGLSFSTRSRARYSQPVSWHWKHGIQNACNRSTRWWKVFRRRCRAWSPLLAGWRQRFCAGPWTSCCACRPRFGEQGG